MTDISDAFIKHRARNLAKEEACKNCYLAEILLDETTGECPFRFIEECCGRFEKIYDRIYAREKKRKWQEIFDTVEDATGVVAQSQQVRDPATITQSEIDAAIEEACRRMDELRHAEHRRWLDSKLRSIDDHVSENLSRDDSSNASRMVRRLQSANEIDVRYAIESLGLMARKYGPDFLQIVGAIDVFVKLVITTENPRIVASCARATVDIAQHGGAMILLENGVARRMVMVVQDGRYPTHVKKVCAEALGWIYGTVSQNKS